MGCGVIDLAPKMFGVCIFQDLGISQEYQNHLLSFNQLNFYVFLNLCPSLYSSYYFYLYFEKKVRKLERDITRRLGIGYCRVEVPRRGYEYDFKNFK